MEWLGEELRGLLGAAPTAIERVSGGDIGRSWRAESGGRALFVKTYADGGDPVTAARMVDAESRGLRWLAEPEALRVPEVCAVSSRLLVLEWIEPGRPVAGTHERLGRGLAALHRHGSDVFGFETDNFIGPLPQGNGPCPSWAEFYGSRRLQPLLERAGRAGLLGGGLERLASRLLAALPERVGPEEPPARLHGDLWGGNWICASDGAPVLIDPSVYGGNREIDLAMMRLFGGFDERVFAAYEEAYPLAAGWRDRVPLYQLHPLLVHLNLFGAGYAGQLEAALRACA